jgi:hypothetical protein
VGKLFGLLAVMGLAVVLGQASVAEAGRCCAKPACCAPPPPVEVKWCVEDPCTCCKQEVSKCLPACCAGQTPCLDSCRPGLLGRKILTYKFPCGECVEVVLTKHGKAIVR